MQINIKEKILKNLGANAYGQLITIIIQLLSVPLYLHYWGVELYGEWLILSTIPAYLALSDIGFSTVAANDMTMRVANGDRHGALEVYQSVWFFVSSISTIVGILLTIIIYNFPIASVLSITKITEEKTCLILIILMLYALVALQGGILLAAFRANGSYAHGMTILNTIRLIEWIATILTIMMGQSIEAVAIMTLFMRLIGMITMWKLLKKQVNWLNIGIERVSLIKIKQLSKPALAFMAFPIGNALNLQGLILIIGMNLGSAAVVIFSTYRTLTRIIVQVITMFTHSVWPEISSAFGSRQMELVRKLHRKSIVISFWIATIVVLILFAYGENFIEIWTRKLIKADNELFLLLIIGAYINVLWQPSWVVLMATNKHNKISIIFLTSSIITLNACAIASTKLDIISIGWILIAIEIPLLFYVVNETLKLVNDKWNILLCGVIGK